MVTRGPKPKPSHLKLIEGNPGKRRLGREVQPRNVAPDPPEQLDALAREEWDRMAPQLYHLGLLTEPDRAALGAYCQAYSTWANAQEELNRLAAIPRTLFKGLLVGTPNGAMIQNPLIGIRNKAAADMVLYAAEFGMTPSARARLAISDAGADPTNKFGGTLWGSKPSGGKG